jgi:ABC-2 type transport system ATP-binding protein
MNGLPEQDTSGGLAVATHGLTLRYGRTTALSDVNLRVPEGAVYVLVGTNGAGKSSALRVLLNLERPDQGRAEVFGFDTAQRGPEVRAQVGYIPESHTHDYGWMTCRRLVKHVASFYPTWDHAYAATLIDAYAVPLGQKVSTLSKGESRRLQFVLALAHRPALLLLDEPTDGLDPLVRSRTLAQLAEHLADTPTTVVITTHHIGEIETLADHIGVLRDGRLVAQMSGDEIRRTVRRYRLEVPEAWQPPPQLGVAGLRRSRTGREVQATLIGEQDDVLARLASDSVIVRDVTPLALEEAALALLAGEDSP